MKTKDEVDRWLHSIPEYPEMFTLVVAAQAAKDTYHYARESAFQQYVEDDEACGCSISAGEDQQTAMTQATAALRAAADKSEWHRTVVLLAIVYTSWSSILWAEEMWDAIISAGEDLKDLNHAKVESIFRSYRYR